MLTYVLLIATGKDYETAFNILIPSFFYFRKEEFYNFIIIYKLDEKKYLDYWINELKIRNFNLSNFSYISENDLVDEIPKNTYYFQMYLKLYIHKIVESEYYLVLDSDHLFCKKFSENNFYSDDKAYYIKEFRKDSWATRCEKLFKIKMNFLFSQTPFVFKKSLLEIIFDKYPVKFHILKNQCSEYTFYQAALQKNNLIEDNYYESKFKENNINSLILNNLNIDEILNNKIDKLFNEFPNIVVSGIQSRLNKHYFIYDKLKNYIPNMFYQKKNIAMLTVISGDEYFERYKDAIEIKRDYCNYHNYEFLFCRSDNKQSIKNGWLKIYFMLKNLKKYDYIFLSDGDVVITNKDKRIEDLINIYNCKAYCCLVTTDYNSINTGNIIWKNCEKSYELLNKIFDLKDDIRYSLKTPFIPKGIYEQPSFIYYYNLSEEYRKLIKIIPQFEINSYTDCFPQLKNPNVIPIIDNIENRCNHNDNDFLIHFAGFNYFNKKRKLPIDVSKLIEKYIKIYYKLQSEKEGSDYGKIK